METSLDRKVNLNISQSADLPNVPEEKTAAQAVLKPLLTRLANLKVTSAPQDLEALLARLGNENANAKETSSKQTLRSVYSTILARLQANAAISAKNLELLRQAETLGNQVGDIQKQIDERIAQLDALKKQLAGQSATVTELEIKTMMLEKQVELAKSQQLTPAEKRLAELKRKRQAEQDKQQQERLDQEIAAAEKELLVAQASVAQAQGELAAAQGALATARGNLVAMQSQVAAASKDIAKLQANKATLEGKIDACVDQLVDEDGARAFVDVLRSVATATKGVPPEDAPERSEGEEKFLEENSVARILQDSADRRVLELEDTIAAKREEKI